MGKHQERAEPEHPGFGDMPEWGADPAPGTAPHPAITESVWRAVQFIRRYAHLPDIVTRAAVVLTALDDAPQTEKWWGGRASMAGCEVKCRTCKRPYTATPEDPYLNATTGADGSCAACFIMAHSRPDAATPVLTGTIVPAPRESEEDTADDPAMD